MEFSAHLCTAPSSLRHAPLPALLQPNNGPLPRGKPPKPKIYILLLKKEAINKQVKNIFFFQN